jgi:hypothetical protein
MEGLELARGAPPMKLEARYQTDASSGRLSEVVIDTLRNYIVYTMLT